MGREQEIERFVQKIAKTETCWLWTGCIHRLGYGHFRVGRKLVSAHRFAYSAFVGPIPEGAVVCHACDVRHCVNPEHLWLGTQQDNVRDMWAKGRAPDRSGPNYRGHERPDNVERNRRILGKLSVEQILEIRSNPAISGVEFGRRFGVHSSIICHVRAGRTYKDIQPA